MQSKSAGHPNRRSIRLRGYNYAQSGAYFVTIVTQDRACLFGEVVDGGMQLSEVGQIVREEWYRSRIIRQEIELDAFVVMPNHIHGIVIITIGNIAATGRRPYPRDHPNVRWGHSSLISNRS